jgi:hypothetical protein
MAQMDTARARLSLKPAERPSEQKAGSEGERDEGHDEDRRYSARGLKPGFLDRDMGRRLDHRIRLGGACECPTRFSPSRLFHDEPRN